MSSAPPTPPRVRRLPLAGVLRIGRPSDIWFKPALSVVVAAGVPNLTLLALGHLDLAMYTMVGSLCVLYAHNLPYAARARALAWVVLGMLASVAIALVTASLTSSAVVLVAVGALLAAVQKALCDATRIGPPGPVIFVFISARLIAADRPDPGALESARRHLAAVLVELRATADAATGEWWQRALPEERVMLAERAGHRTLAATVRRQGLHALEGAQA